MKIKNHRLIGDDISFKATPKTSGEFQEGKPDTIIIHYTAGNSTDIAVRVLTNPKPNASAHMVVGRDGEVVQLADLNVITWHAGRSGYVFPNERRGYFNKYSIGIEIANDGFLDKDGDKFFNWYKGEVPKDLVYEGRHRNFPQTRSLFWHTYTDKQIKKVYKICKEIIKEYPSVKYILGHEEIAPGRKSDPGPAFPLDDLRKKMKVWIPGEPAPETLEKDEKVLVIAKSGDWYYVEQEITGWVSKKYIDRDNSDNEEDGVVNASVLNIRDKPNGDKVAKPLSKGQKVTIFKQENGWYQVETKAKGWVASRFIKLLQIS